MEAQIHNFWEPAGFIAGIVVGVITWAVTRKAIDARFTHEQQGRRGVWGFYLSFFAMAFPSYLLLRYETIWSTLIGGVVFTAPISFFWSLCLAYRYRNWQLRSNKQK